MSSTALSRRRLLKSGGALVIGFGFAGRSLAQVLTGADAALGKTVDVSEVDDFLAIHTDGTVTVYSGKVDLGTGHRIAVRQMAAEELGIGVERIKLVEGDSALTPDQGTTAGSTGIARGGVQVRQAAATARAALIRMGAERLGLAMNLEATWDEIEATIHAHPTLSEMIKEATEVAKGHPIHV